MLHLATTIDCLGLGLGLGLGLDHYPPCIFQKQRTVLNKYVNSIVRFLEWIHTLIWS